MGGTENMWDDFFSEEAGTEETLDGAEGIDEAGEDGSDLDEEGGNPSGGDPAEENGGSAGEDGSDLDEEGGNPSGGDPAEENGGSAGEDGSDLGGEPEGGFDAEMQARIDAEAQKRVDAAIRRQFAGTVNPYTGKPITTEAELNAYKAAFEAEQQRSQLENMGIDQEQLNKIVQNLPEVQLARQMLAAQQQEQAKNMMQEQFDALKKEYPDCGFADTAAMLADGEGRKVLEFWRDSPRLTIADAYLVLNKDKIRKQQNKAVKQGAMNQMNSKKHLTQTRNVNTKGDVPPDVVASYKLFMPGVSMEKISEMYWKNKENSEN